jgi:RNA polymerase sigma factor (sigma-70 family)
MASLPDKLRAALVLSVVDGRPTAEVAEICGCSAATVYWRIHQARKKLKYMLKE